jgi:hypothetical protein
MSAKTEDKKAVKKPRKTRKKTTTPKTSVPKKRTRTATKTVTKKKAKTTPKPKEPVTKVAKGTGVKIYPEKKGKKFETGISKLDIAIIFIGLRKQIMKRMKGDDASITLQEALELCSYLFLRLSKKASHKVFKSFCFAQSKSFDNLTPIIVQWLGVNNQQGGSDMAKIKLGITLPEIMGMVPELMMEAWGAYSDDKQLSADEGVVLCAVLMEQLGGAADHEAVAAFFTSQGLALRDLAPLLVSEDEEEEEEKKGKDE